GAGIVQGRGGIALQAHPAQGQHQQFANVALVVDDQGTGLGTTVGYAHLRSRYRVAALRPSTTRSDSAGHRHALLPFALGVAKWSRRGCFDSAPAALRAARTG